MYILGISCFYHDSAATLLKDGRVVAASEEERFSRKKHDFSFPWGSINYCLESENIDINQVDYIGFYEKPLLKFERVLSQCLETFPKSWKIFTLFLPNWFTEKLRIVKIIKKKFGYRGDVIFIEHHLSHAASSFLPSPFKKAAILNIDAVGEWATTSFGIGENNQIKLLKKINFPHSLGLLYSSITAYLGFKVNNSEYKVMGLSSYGNKNKNDNPYYNKLKKVVDIKSDGSFRLDMSYFSYHYTGRMPSKKICSLLGGRIRFPEEEISQRDKDIAAALQLVTEEILIKSIKHIHRVLKCDNLVLAGGVALNSMLNGKILSRTPFKNLWIQPNASDAGGSMGVAFYIYNCILEKKRKPSMKAPYFGPKYSTDYIEKVLKENNIKYSYLTDSKKLLIKTAELIYKNNIIALFRGRMEWGPRALGNRSILANPCNPKMKDILNYRIKKREGFRPFAPVICEEDVSDYFECDKPIPLPTRYMLMIYKIKFDQREKIPSVVHVDGTGRLQAIERSQNQFYYDLIKAFGETSGVPVLINTSFNTMGQPIVCSPEDALECMKDSDIDYLIMENFLINRKQNLNN